MNEQKKERNEKRNEEKPGRKNCCIPIRMLFVILFLTFTAKFAENLIFI